jgi:hypothetical protein
MELTHPDRQSETWKKIKTHLTARLQTLREKNDGQLDPIQTAQLRGEIGECKKLLALEPIR